MRELATLFLKLGATAFGGPAAHIAMMEDEVVRRRAWLTREEFLDLLGATNLIPGPNSTEMALHVGWRLYGFPGLLVAGVCFILPAALIVTGVAWAYVRYGALPAAIALLAGVKPVIIAVVAQALFGLGRTALRGPRLSLLGLAALLAVAGGVHELVVLALAGVLAMVIRRGGTREGGGRSLRLLTPLALPSAARASEPLVSAGAAAVVTSAAVPVSLSALFLLFLKIGSVLFGSGYVLLAFLRADFVLRRPWLTEAQLMDAVAVGQVTPGPVFTTATFIGYLLGGFSGGAVATLAIFLPAFVFVALSGPLVPALRRSPAAGAFLDGVNVASLALMALVSGQLARSSLVDIPSIALALVSAVLLVRFRVNSAVLVALGAALGLLRAWPG
jgi:chromate transporter